MGDVSKFCTGDVFDFALCFEASNHKEVDEITLEFDEREEHKCGEKQPGVTRLLPCSVKTSVSHVARDGHAAVSTV